jgi:hypothetical protein
MFFRMLARRRQKGKGGSSPTNAEGWMMSYADMATTLLAMFIVLSTLGKDQTGISLYNGTGSFIQSSESFGLPGFLPNSSRAIPLETVNPRYPVAAGQGNQADSVQRIIDGEEQQFQQFLNEMNRQLRVDKLPRVTGQAVVDLYDKLNNAPPYLGAKHKEVVGQILPALQRKDYRVYVVVWAPMPSKGAWLRTANQAQALGEEIAAAAGLDDAARARLVPLGQPWRHRDVPRPVLSFVLAKTEPPS